MKLRGATRIGGGEQGIEITNQQCSRHRFFAEVQQELLQSHRLIVDADYKVAQLGEEKLDVLVGELAQLVAEHMVDASVVSIATRGVVSCV